MCSPSAPPPPDYLGASREEGEQARQTALFNTGLNRVSQYGPYGSSTWSLRPGADPNNPQPGDFVQTTTLDPAQQRLLSGQAHMGGTLLEMAGPLMDQLRQNYGQPMDTSSLPGLRTVNASGQPVVGSLQTPSLQMELDRSELPALTQGEESRQAIIDAMMSRFNTDIGKDQQALETRLLQSGVERGTDAWNREMEMLGRRKNDALNQAFIGSGAEMSRLSDIERANRSQLFGETAAAGQFANTAAGQDFAQRREAGDFANDAAREALQTAIMAATQGNQTRQQGFNELSFLRGLPMNELQAIRGASMPQLPNFPGVYSGQAGQTGGALDAAIAQGNSANARYAADSQAAAQQQQLAATAAMLYFFASDRRLKTNIRTVGLHPSGVRRVAWDWKDGSGSGVGVIAQELQAVRPDAVASINGYLHVCYDLIGGR